MSAHPKYGVPADAMFARVEGAARESGIRSTSTRCGASSARRGARAHAARGAEGNAGGARTGALRRVLLEGNDVGDHAVLAAIAAQHGFTEDEAIAILADGDERATTKQQAAAMSRQGIRGVPFFIVDRELAFSGAQSVETMKDVIEKALAAQADQARTDDARDDA